MKFTVVLLSMLFLAGCAHNVFVKPGATAQDWNRDHNNCLVKANQAGFRGGDLADTISRNNFIEQCLNGEGWNKQSQESLTQQKAASESVQHNFKVQMDDFASRRNNICAKPDYQRLLAKTPCSSNDITMQQLTDESKISKAMKPVLLKFRAEMSTVDKETASFIRTSIISEPDRKWADFMDTSFSEIEAYNLDFYRGKLSWGEYNQRRKDQGAKIQAKQREIFGSHS